MYWWAARGQHTAGSKKRHPSLTVESKKQEFEIVRYFI